MFGLAAKDGQHYFVDVARRRIVLRNYEGRHIELTAMRCSWQSHAGLMKFLRNLVGPHDFVGSALAAHEGLVRPDVRPIAVASAVRDAGVVEIPVDSLRRRRRFKIEDPVGVLDVKSCS